MFHGLAEPDCEGCRGGGLFKGVESLGDDEDVIDADTEKKERNDGMSCRVEKAEHGAQAIAEYHTHGNTEESNYRQPEPLLHAVKLAEHEVDVDEDQDISSYQLVSILESLSNKTVKKTVSEY